MTRVLLMEQRMFGAPYLWSNLHACNDKGIADGAAYVWSNLHACNDKGIADGAASLHS